VSVFGRSGMGRETLLGYAHIHLPVFGGRRPGDQAELLEAPILKPQTPAWSHPDGHQQKEQLQ